MTRLFASRMTREFSPGDTWAYSNTGYLLLGDIIERGGGAVVLGVSATFERDPSGRPRSRKMRPGSLARAVSSWRAPRAPVSLTVDAAAAHAAGHAFDRAANGVWLTDNAPGRPG